LLATSRRHCERHAEANGARNGIGAPARRCSVSDSCRPIADGRRRVRRQRRGNLESFGADTSGAMVATVRARNKPATEIDNDSCE